MAPGYKVLFSVLVSIVLYCVIFYYLPVPDRTLINLLGVVGFLLSILGLAISYIQIMSALESSELAQKEVSEAQERFEEKIQLMQENFEVKINAMQEKLNESMVTHSNLHMIADLSSKGAMIGEIQGYLRDNNIKMSAIRMRDLKALLMALQNQSRYSTLAKKEEFKAALVNFHINLDNLQRQHFRAGKIDLGKINQDLEALSGVFLSVEHNLKKLQ